MNMYLFTALVVSFSAALIIVWRKQNRIMREMSKYQEDLISVRAHVSASVKEFQSRPATSGGNTQNAPEKGDNFNLDMSIGEIIASHPQAQNVLADNHLGGCTSCAVSGEHKLGDAIDEYGIDQNALLTGLNGLVGS
ncbi:MAG: hypothetical protein HOF96_02495 [Candidatus Marinimicrobia bacterium]|jgi:hybrid cluster-associated redox disulfide protein|nr:hypothetical protein [Candidatus Neomarinimicrobiota bacterium]MBT3823826.1 hypothetical protein [Candidatus Neomarinimicrobiota bacterium]MBT4129841.1 hypothetical protein [Candidatus Neomarinimicrobiota bacterium]MBT4420789.1 hypothetical protein [Candidatus Neomarinimicrobiota bacterium]MBT4991788.1 hypothetical protein [Candidatus Neomarinimicrobiota bacterium]